MKLRPELLLAIALAAGVYWILLEQRVPRGAGEVEHGSPAPRPSEGAAELPSVPELVPSAEVSVPSQEEESSIAPAGREAQPPTPAVHDARPTSRGLLVDAATLEPIPDALVATSKLNDWTDAGGWFDTGDALDGLDGLVVANVMMGSASTHEVERSSWTRVGTAWRVSVAIGPTYRLRFRDVEVQDAQTWEGRIQRETGADDLWHPVRKGSPPYLRYDDPLRVLVPGEEAWLEVRSTDGLHQGRGEVESLVGIHEVEINCRARAVLSGRVVDEAGLPWMELDLDAFQVSPVGVESLRARTGVDGSYHLSAREPGRMQVVLEPPADTRTRTLKLTVPLGITQAPDLVVERRSPGSVRGLLRCRNKEVLVQGLLRLRALDGSGFEAFSGFDLGGRRIGSILLKNGKEDSRPYTPPCDTT